MRFGVVCLELVTPAVCAVLMDLLALRFGLTAAATAVDVSTTTAVQGVVGTTVHDATTAVQGVAGTDRHGDPTTAAKS